MPPPSDVGSKEPGQWGVIAPLLLLWWLPWVPPLLRLLHPDFPELVSVPAVGITDSSRTQFAILALLALYFSRWRPSLGGRKDPGTWVVAFLGWSTLSGVLGPDPVESCFFLLGWVAAAAVLWSAPSIRTGQPDWRWWALAVHAPLILGCVISLLPALTASQDFRAAGPFQLPGALAAWLLMVLPLALADLFRVPDRGLPLALATASSAFAVCTLAMTFSRAAWLIGAAEITLLLLLEAGCSRRTVLKWAGVGGLGLAILVLFRQSLTWVGLVLGVLALTALPLLAISLTGRLPRRTVGRLILLAVLATGLLAISRPVDQLGAAARDRLSTLAGTDDSASGRLQLWQAALALSLQHPILGVAPGRFSEAYPEVQDYYYYYSDSAHGTLLELAAEVGWIGVGLAFMAALTWAQSRRPDPWSDPAQRAPLLGLLMGCLYSQVEVAYHFAALWTTAAFLAALSSPPQPARRPAQGLPAAALLLLIPLVSSFFLQRYVETSVRQSQAEETYHMARQASDLMPIWPRPLLTALSYGFRATRPDHELQPLLERALRWARGFAVTYQFSGELALRQKRFQQAREDFLQALKMDRFNHPGVYTGLLLIAQETGDAALQDSITKQVLETYDLDGWKIAHQGHREKLALELRPLLYDIADGLNPYQQPAATEPLYRFLVATGGEARGFFGLGIALTRLGKQEEGQRMLRQANRLDPIYPAP